MKKAYIILSLGLSMTLFFHCGVKKKQASAGKDTKSMPVTGPSMTQAEIAQKRWPGTTQAQLDNGNTIYHTDCKKCHDVPAETKFGEEKWGQILDAMAPKAKLTEPQKSDLKLYILSQREYLLNQ
ncbi:MAG: hypothetical protein JNL57_09515 [Bacteroidetes bacterium]|nr:hypothetical protein [Bacteroidota bacterium]